MISKLPIGIQTFRQIREEGFYYVNKTLYASRLVEDAGKHYFLSRPRRFGKSLFVDTLKELFEGSERLFRAVWQLTTAGTGRSATRWYGWTSAGATSSSPRSCTRAPCANCPRRNNMRRPVRWEE